MTDVQAATDMEVAAAAGMPVEGMALGVTAYVVAALTTEALWLGVIGWWLLHLF